MRCCKLCVTLCYFWVYSRISAEYCHTEGNYVGNQNVRQYQLIHFFHHLFLLSSHHCGVCPVNQMEWSAPWHLFSFCCLSLCGLMIPPRPVHSWSMQLTGLMLAFRPQSNARTHVSTSGTAPLTDLYSIYFKDFSLFSSHLEYPSPCVLSSMSLLTLLLVTGGLCGSFMHSPKLNPHCAGALRTRKNSATTTAGWLIVKIGIWKNEIARDTHF